MGEEVKPVSRAASTSVKGFQPACCQRSRRASSTGRLTPETAGYVHPSAIPLCWPSALLNSTPAQSLNHCMSCTFLASDHCSEQLKRGPLNVLCVANFTTYVLLCILQLLCYGATRAFHILPGLDAPDLGTPLRCSHPSQPSQQSFRVCLRQKVQLL